MAATFEAKTGRSVSEWVALVDAAGVTGFKPTVTWLKENHGLGHFQARLIAEEIRDRDKSRAG